jgi:hypothetical protein
LLAADPALAYVGPGAGLEFVGYFMALLATVGAAFLSMLLYPIYKMVRFLRGLKEPASPEPPSQPAAHAPAVPAVEHTSPTPG